MTVSAVGALIAVAATGCGQQRSSHAPTPEFIYGQRAMAAAPAPLPAPTGGDTAIDESNVEADMPTAGDVSPDQLVFVDDAGNQTPNTVAWEAFDRALQQRLIPSDSAVSVAVMVNGEIVHRAAFGSRVPGGSEATETTDRFRVASISKTITAIATMQLVDRGMLSLDEPVGQIAMDYLGMPGGDPNAASITVRQLLTHTSGFAQNESVFFGGKVASCRDAARIGLGGGISSGRSFRYSNMNYCVLGLVLEAVTGKTYERVVHDNLLVPLGIEGMRFTSTHELGPDEVSHFPTPGRNFMEVLGAAGAWNATPADLVTILNSINPNTPGWKALSEGSMAHMRYRDDVNGTPGAYGLGIINYGGNSWGHTGTIEHTHAMILAQPNNVEWAITVAGDNPSSTGHLRSIMNSAFAQAFG